MKFLKIIFFMMLLLSIKPTYGFQLLNNKIIIDDGGRKIKIKKNYNRIISLYPAHTENIVAVGGTDSLIGISRSDTYPAFIL